EFEEKCVKKMILFERSEFIIFSIFTKNFSKFRTSLDFFFGSFLLYQDKRNEHKLVFENRMLRRDHFKRSVETGRTGDKFLSIQSFRLRTREEMIN
ncbi:MAG: hypothetical protein DRP50_06150, partial [Thermotoga sp.]